MTDKEKLEAIKDIVHDTELERVFDCRPCPFCGSEDIQVVERGYIQRKGNKVVRATWYYCECHDCCASRDVGCAQTIKDAVDAWNERAEE